MVERPNTRLMIRLASVRIPTGEIAEIADRRLNRAVPSPFFLLKPGSNPSNHKLLTPLQKKWYPLSGG